MARSPKYILAGRYFYTKAEARDFIHNMLAEHTKVTPGVRDVSLDDDGIHTVSVAEALVLNDLLRHHPDAKRKIGAGIQCWQVRCNRHVSGNATWGFGILRQDGSYTPVSYLHCFEVGTHHREMVGKALRDAIAHQMTEHKDRVYGSDPGRTYVEPLSTIATVPCAICGEPVRRQDAHSDHEPPMRIIRDAWYGVHHLKPQDLAIAPRGPEDDAYLLADDAMTRAWQEYHRANARLRIVHSRCNLEKGGRHAAAD